jgi:hypothetical protein
MPSAPERFFYKKSQSVEMKRKYCGGKVASIGALNFYKRTVMRKQNAVVALLVDFPYLLQQIAVGRIAIPS